MRRIAAALLVALSALLSIAGQRAAATPSAYYSPVTGQVLSEPFLTGWADGGAFATYGQPVTKPVAFGAHTTQFFQFGALDVPTKQASETTASVTRLPVGAQLLAVLSGQDQTVAGRHVGGFQTAAFAPAGAGGETAATVDGRFTAFYDANGGEDRFGRPLSTAYRSGGDLIQWFEYGRLEIRFGATAVTIAPVGYELAARLGVLAAPAEQGNLPLLDQTRFHLFKGDGTVPEETGPFAPVEIKIPSIAVDAKIEQIQIVNGVMGTPADAWNVGWYTQLSSPGEWTNVVMAGHLDWWGIGPTVFYHLDQVKRGDKIYLIDKNGKGATYQVMRSYAVDANADPTPIVGDAGIEMLTLITCGGDFDGSEYLSRQIVRAKRI